MKWDHVIEKEKFARKGLPFITGLTKPPHLYIYIYTITSEEYLRKPLLHPTLSSCLRCVFFQCAGALARAVTACPVSDMLLEIARYL